VIELDPSSAEAGPTAGLRPSLRAFEAVAHELAVLVRAGHFVPGDRLPSERQLAARFGVSRPTVRVALGALESMGLVETRPGSGTFVAQRERTSADGSFPATDENPAELMEARIALEVAVARLAARRVPANAEALEEVRLTVEALERVASPQDVPDEIDRDFHRAVARLTGNAYVVALLEPVWESMSKPLFTALLRRSWSAELTERTAVEHRSILEALRARDPELAAFAMERHLRALVAAIFDEDAFEGPPPRFFA
jgi:DNA-binding FadR family transcriptional regulator